jgi:nucleoside-triphosphatase
VPTESRLLLLTGARGIGKTTALRRVASGLRETSVRGFYTEEMRSDGQRVRFRLVGFGGEQGIIAHVDFHHRHRVGKYRVDVSAVDRLANELLARRPDVELYPVDEIGRMECLSAVFVARMAETAQTKLKDETTGFYMERILPRTSGLFSAILSGSGSIMAFKDEAF